MEIETEPQTMEPIDYNNPQMWSGNRSGHGNLIEDITMDTNFAMLLCSLIFAIAWVIYITYYNSRLVGYIITKIVNKLFIRDGYFKIGSFTLNALSGKIMFRDVAYITSDYSLRIQDGYLIFRWWRSYVPKDVSEDLSHSDTRLSVVLNGFELHIYNRSGMYFNLVHVFGLDPGILPDDAGSPENNETNNSPADISTEVVPGNNNTRKQRSEATMARTWRDLIPVIKIDISSCRLVFGNRLVPTTLSVTIEESHFVYSTKPAVCELDRFMHFTKCKAENARVMLVPSPKYTGMSDEPPRYMGEGFVLMSTNDLELYFYMDEAGLVREGPVSIKLANGDTVEPSPPQWGIDIKCGKGTDFSYGTWADRQREHLFKFFYPQDYQPMQVTQTPKPGEKRQMQSFEIRLLMQNKATVDILFSKNKETNAIHINVGAGSYLEISIPWVTTEKGYTTKINGQLLHLEATTSLQFRDLLVSETLEFSVLCHYPLIWNDHQLWELNLTGCKATVSIIFCHKWFFTDLINDWSSKQRPDLLHFLPYTWRFGLTLKHCEIITLANQYNWVDCSSAGQRLENTQIALCAHFLHMSFDLPFDEFLPETLPLNFSIQGESIDLSIFIPEFHTSRGTVTSLEKFAKVRSKDGSTTTKKTEIIPKWRSVCSASNGWVDFWWVPIGAINISYVYHPCPPLGPTPQADISTPVKEENLLSPMRIPRQRKPHRSPQDCVRFDPTTLKSDVVTVELEIGPSVLLLYGTALRNFLNLKENIFGDDQMFTDMQQSPSSSENSDVKSEEGSADVPLELQEDFDHRNYRPLEVDVSVIMHDVQGHLLKNCMEKDPSCPVVLVERFGFEMKKRYDQTELQLLLSPSILLVSDNVIRPSKEKHLSEGRLTLSSLQIRGHAMFSDVGRTLDQDTIEYAWLIDVQLGRLSGKLSSPQLHSILTCLETLILLLADSENELNSPAEDVLLHEPQVAQSKSNTHQNFFPPLQQFLQNKTSGTNTAKNVSQNSSNATVQKNEKIAKNERKASETTTNTKEKKTNTASNNETDVSNIDCHKLKYRVSRLAVDAVDFWLVESGVALQLWVSPVRLATCNLHGKQVGSGLSCVIYSMSIRQSVWQSHKYTHAKTDNNDIWLEVGTVDLGPLIIESAMSSDAKDNDMFVVQQKFLKMHDDKFKKLWFLWPDLNKAMGRCGCVGGCQFFGSNKNGTRFFKPSRKDLEDGANVAAFRVNEPGRDPGYGQSILHEGQLIFRTPPYIVNDMVKVFYTRGS
ncbi:Kiaa1109 [Popillia japonica]|uniref:Kiaa1109 n=1 Tax=Popillia japonica TaxID=7064 RepID=A0AAW1MVT4_POPJA